MLTVQINESEVKEVVRQHVKRLVDEVDSERVFWDAEELKRRVCMSWNTLQGSFFFDPRFPKRKIGGKWYFPARQTREFLEQWLDEQPRN